VLLQEERMLALLLSLSWRSIGSGEKTIASTDACSYATNGSIPIVSVLINIIKA